MKNILFRVADALCMPLIFKDLLQKNKVTILVFHDPVAEVFDRYMEILKELRFTFISMDEAVAALRTGAVADLGPNPVVVTIDDGRAGNYALLPIIKNRRIRPIIYVCSQIVGTKRVYWDDFIIRKNRTLLNKMKRMSEEERRALLWEKFRFHYEDEFEGAATALSWPQIRELSRFADIGSHGRFHQPLSYLSESEMWEEVALSKSEIEEMVGKECRHFAFPSGFHNAKCREAVKMAGYDSARSTDPGFNVREEDVYRLRVTGASDDGDDAKFRVQISGAARLAKRLLLLGR